MFTRVGDIEVYYEERGAGKPVLMIHGYGIDHHVMTGCMEPVFENRIGYRRIYFDLPGMGLTKASRSVCNSDIMLELLISFIDQVIPEGNFLVAGESYGGYLARALIGRMPERVAGLLLICPMMIPDRAKRTLPQRAVFVRDAAFLETLTPYEREQFEPMAAVQDKATWAAFKRDIMPDIEREDSRFTTWFQQHGYALSYDVDKIPPFPKPFLLFAGRQDASVGYRDQLKLLDNYPRGTFAILDRAGHSLQIEQPAIFQTLVSEWLDRIEEIIQ